MPGWIPAGTDIAGKPAMFQAAANGAERTAPATLAAQERSPQRVASIGGWASTGDMSRSYVVRVATICSRQVSTGPSASSPRSIACRPNAAWVRVRFSSSAGSRCAASSATPANHRAKPPIATALGTTGSNRSIECPACRRSPAEANTARRCSRSTVSPGNGGLLATPMVSVGPSAASVTRAYAGSPAITESTSAASRTVVASGPFSASPYQSVSPRCAGTTPRPGLRPTSPQHAAGILMEPMPSAACATGTMPAATAAAEPPLEPPGVREGAQGLRVTP